MENSVIFFVVAVALTLCNSFANPTPDDKNGRTLTMHLTVESGSETAVPMRGGTVTFRCDIQDYEEAAHIVSWTHFHSASSTWIVLAEAGTLREPAGSRFLVSRVQGSTDTDTGNVHQRLVINNVAESDIGLYRCNVMSTFKNSSTCNDEPMSIASREVALVVNAPEVFPICTPSSKAPDPLVPGNLLSCGTLTADRTPVVTRRGNAAGVLEPWPRSSRRDGRPGWELTKKVNATDDGVTYDCWSFPTDFSAGENAFSCTIEPYVVTSSEPEPPKSLLSVGAIIGIALAACFLLLVTITLCIIKCKSGS